MDINKIRMTHLPEYSEEAAVNALSENLCAALEHQCRVEEEHGTIATDQIVITVNGVAHAFFLGGPQAEGVFSFIEQICDENLYDLPAEMSVRNARREHVLSLNETISRLQQSLKDYDKLNEEYDNTCKECCALTDKVRDIKNFYAHYSSPYDYTLDVAERGMLYSYFLQAKGGTGKYKTPKTILMLPEEVQVELKDYIHKYLIGHLNYSYDDFLDGTYTAKCIESFAEDEMRRAEQIDEEELECMDLEDQLETLLK